MQPSLDHHVLLEAVLERADVGLCLVGPDDRPLAANAQWLSFTGLIPEQLRERHILDLLPKGCRLTASVIEQARSGETVHLPRYCQRVGERGLWWEITVSPLPVSEDVALLISAREVSAQVRAEQEREEERERAKLLEELRRANEELVVASLRQKELAEELCAQKEDLQLLARQLEEATARLEAIISSAPEAIVVADREARLLLANPVAERLYARQVPYEQGYESHAEMWLSYPDGSPYAPRDLPLTRSALDGETFTNVEMVIVWPDGQRRDLLVNSAPIRGQRGEILGGVGVFQDITPNKEAERERTRLLTQLWRQAAELDATIASITDGIVIYSQTGEVVRMNPAAERILGNPWPEEPQLEQPAGVRIETPEGGPIPP